MNEAKRKAWTSFVAVDENFLDKRKAENYVEVVIVSDLLSAQGL